MSISKRTFLPIFQLTWNELFILMNILRGFEKAGIWLFKPLVVLNLIQRLPKDSSNNENKLEKLPSTPITSKSIRYIQKLYKADPYKENLDLIFRS